MTSTKYQVKFLCSATLVIVLLSSCWVPTESKGLYWLQDFLTNSRLVGGSGSNSSGGAVSLGRSAGAQPDQVAAQLAEQAQQVVQQDQAKTISQQPQQQQPTSEFTVAGFRPSNIASLLNTVSETGFTYFNVQNQCRSRTACDMGHMLYKKLNFVHNWVIRASVRTLVDSSNMYAQAWNNGMMGRNCTLSFPSCHQSPLESLMSVASLSGFFNY